MDIERFVWRNPLIQVGTSRSQRIGTIHEGCLAMSKTPIHWIQYEGSNFKRC